MGRAGGEAVLWVEPFGGGAVFPGLDVPGEQHSLAAKRRGVQAAEHAPAAAVVQHLLGEHVLTDPGSGHQDALSFPFAQPAAGGDVACYPVA